MPDLTDPLIFVVATLAISAVIWFAIGSAWNMKRGNDVLRWLRSALPSLGERTTLQWLGTSVVKLNIAKAKDPFKEVEIVVAMEPRDVPVLWLHGHLNGRRDTLIFRGLLRQPPEHEVELVHAGLWTGREALAQIDQKAWSKVRLDRAGDGGPEGTTYVALANGARAANWLQEWFARSTRLAPELARISVRRSAQYQLQWHGSVPNLAATNSAQIIQLVRQIGREASAEQ